VTGTERYLLPLVGVFVLAWVGLALYVLLTRLAHELVDGALRATQRLVRRAGVLDAAALTHFVRRLPRGVLERAVADPATPRDLAGLFAEYLLQRRPSRIVADAGRESRRSRWRRVRALQIIVRARSPLAVPLLEDALRSGDEETAAAAVALLGEVGDLRAARALVDALSANSFARSRIAAQLDRSRDPVPQLLVPLLYDADPQLRFWGATLLARYAGQPRIDLELTRAARDDAPATRAAAVESLAARRSEAARPTAVALLRDPVWFVRAHAARALHSLGGDDGGLVAPLLADESWWVRAAAKETLEAQPAFALATLVEYLQHDDRFARNGAAEVLQNTGVLDLLLADERELDTTGRILAAGGRRLARTAAARNGLDPERLEQLAAADG